MRCEVVRPVFTDVIPTDLEPGHIYVSIPYGSVLHLCCCGCGEKVSTPLDPAQWRVTYDGQSISLHPSVGSHSLECRSHYWIDHNRVVWSSEWSADRAARAREVDNVAINESLSARTALETDTERTIWSTVRKSLGRSWQAIQKLKPGTRGREQ